MKVSRCKNCGEYYQYLQSQCPNCGTLKEVKQLEDETEIIVTILEPNSLTKNSTSSEYSVKPEDIAVPVELLSSFLEDTDPHTVSMRGVLIHAKTDEQKVWSATPHSLVVMLILAQWIPGIISAALLLAIFKGSWIWMFLLLFIAFLHIILHSIAIRAIRYRISSQRLEITDGLLHQQIRTYEVHHLSDATINIPFPLGLFGLSYLSVRHRYGRPEINFPHVRIFHSVPNNQIPYDINLIGIPKEEARLVRDILRNSGQIEGERFDKFRVR